MSEAADPQLLETGNNGKALQQTSRSLEASVLPFVVEPNDINAPYIGPFDGPKIHNFLQTYFPSTRLLSHYRQQGGLWILQEHPKIFLGYHRPTEDGYQLELISRNGEITDISLSRKRGARFGGLLYRLANSLEDIGGFCFSQTLPNLDYCQQTDVFLIPRD